MGKRFHACDLNQPFLLSPVVQDWLAENHLARFIAEVCGELDLSGIMAWYERRDGRGKAAYHPLMLTRLLLYAYAIGVRSSRQIERATKQDLAFRFLAANQHPDHDTIAAFRQEHLEELSALFTQVLQLCREAKLLQIGLLAVDGTKIQASASRSQSHRYRDLQVSEEKLKERMQQLLLEAAQVDAGEASQEQLAVDSLPPEYSSAAARLARIQQAKAALEQHARQRAEEVKQEMQQAKAAGQRPCEAMRKRHQRHRSGVPAGTDQYNFTDPDSRLMKQTNGGGYVQGYNAQVAVDAESQVIVAGLVAQNADDRDLLLPVIEAVRQQQMEPVQVVADSGYWSGEALQDERLKAIDVLVPPDGRWCRDPEDAPAVTASKSALAQATRARLRTPEGSQLYRKRQAVVEPVFGRIKELRALRRFGLRGLEQVQAEWALICLTHNLLKLHKHRTQASQPPRAPRAKAFRAGKGSPTRSCRRRSAAGTAPLTFPAH